MNTKLIILLFFSFVQTKAQWQPTSGPYCDLLTKVTSNGGNVFAGCFEDGMFLSTDDGATWIAVNNGLGFNHSIFSLTNIGGNVFAGTRNDGIFMTMNNGASWAAMNTGLTDYKIFSLAGNSSYIFAGTYQSGVFSSANNGASWTIDTLGLGGENVRSLAIDGNNIYAGTYNNGVFLSTNNGANWISVNNGIGSGSVNALAVNGGNVFAGTASGLYLSTNNGGSWTPDTLGMGSANINAIEIVANNIFAATGSGMYLSTNGGVSWITDTTFSGGVISGSAFAISGGYIFSTSSLNTVWKRSLSGLLGENNIKDDFDAVKIYPNPTTGKFSFTFNKTSDYSSLKIVNFIGQVIYSYTFFEGRGEIVKDIILNQTPGIYFVKLNDGSKQHIKKIVVE
jgi:hypothetical protein